MKLHHRILPVIACSLLAACSTITTGTTQPINIKTPHVTGAKCELVDSKGARWVISDSPGTREITKGDGPLTVTCSKPGYKTEEVFVEEQFAGMTAGNILLGGGIGIIVDAASGAAQEYPDDVYVWMEPLTWKSSAAKEEWLAEKAAFEAEQEAKKAAQTPDSHDEKEYN